ncbi:MAG TPA: Gfo/Idh/MocA family oxidoreductase [Firmicutes bacterium]|nr:Gfo/Idh/MocA family oxidoreductase [Bacillota bacterium]
MERVKVGIIGATGGIAPVHIESLRRLGVVEIYGVASSSLERAQNIARRLGVPRAYGGYEELLQDPDVVAVHNCTPNHLHFAINKKALESGKHIISEKPLARDASETLELARLADSTQTTAAVCFNYRYYPLVQEAKALIDAGEVGEIRFVSGTYLGDWFFRGDVVNWRMRAESGGSSRVLADIGTHWFDLVEYVTGLRITRVMGDRQTFLSERRPEVNPGYAGSIGTGVDVQAHVSSGFKVDTDDYASVLLIFENGARGSAMFSDVAAGRKGKLCFEIYGSKKSLAWDQENPNVLWVGRHNKPNAMIMKDLGVLSDRGRRFARFASGESEGFSDAFTNLFDEIYGHIAGTKDSRNFPTFADGHRATLISDCIVESCREGKWVEVKSQGH